MRRDLLERGEIVERRLTIEDAQNADELFLINSVRGRFSAVLNAPGRE
jgi:branched-subunit amino acid aminotransferase/4-amino-4-deoxychorismate lyase